MQPLLPDDWIAGWCAELSGPTWSTMREALGVVACRRNLSRTLLTAQVVGTVLFSTNQLDVVLPGGATAAVWFKTGLDNCVPFAVSNIGILTTTHRRPEATQITA